MTDNGMIETFRNDGHGGPFLRVIFDLFLLSFRGVMRGGKPAEEGSFFLSNLGFKVFVFCFSLSRGVIRG